MTTATDTAVLEQTADAIRKRQRFVIASHVRPDGDAVGSSLAMALALRHLGKEVRVVSRDLPPPPLQAFPGVSEVEILARVDDPGDAVIVMESGDLLRTGITGLERGFVINIDHHVGNSMFGAINWFDVSAAACGEMVFDLVRELGVPLSHDIAVHLYVAILTDTGSFHHSNITPRTFEICRQCVVAGVNPSAVARSLFDSNNLGRLKLMGAVLSRMQLDSSGRLATVSVDEVLVTSCNGTYEDTEGLINLPLTVREIQAVVFFKQVGPDDWRVSMRSKGDVDINAVARAFGGGGHKNASGCSASGSLDHLKRVFQEKITEQMDKASSRPFYDPA
jgi:phosphoesterase RecJ-like protein